MIRRLALIIGLLVTAASSSAYDVSGRITGGTNQGLKYVWAIPTNLDTPFVTIAIPYFNTYSFIGGLPEGSYVVFAFQDVSANALPDPDEMRGFYGGMPPEVLVLTSDTSDIDIQLSSANSGGFTGAVSYSGPSSGATLIMVHRTPSFSDSVQGIGVVLSMTGVGNYTAFVDSFGTYYGYAFMDLNLNLQHDPAEPYGLYGGSTPAAINVQPGNFPEDVNIVLEDPSGVCVPEGTLPGCSDLGEAYPNPFNSVTVVPFTLAATEFVNLSVFDVLGRRVAVLANGVYGAGSHQVRLGSAEMPSGLYFLMLETNTTQAIRRILLLK